MMSVFITIVLFMLYLLQLSRRKLKRDRQAQLRKLCAVRTIQNFGRGSLARAALELLLRKRIEEKLAAILIESMFRCWKATRRVAYMRRLKEDECRSRAAILLQRHFRGIIGRGKALSRRAKCFIKGALVRKIIASLLNRRAVELCEERNKLRSLLLAPEEKEEMIEQQSIFPESDPKVSDASEDDTDETVVMMPPVLQPRRIVVPRQILCELCALREGVLGPTSILAALAEGTLDSDLPYEYLDDPGECERCGHELVPQPRIVDDQEGASLSSTSSRDSVENEDLQHLEAVIFVQVRSLLA